MRLSGFSIIMLLFYCFVDPLKYFGYELGAQTMIDAKNERYIVNGSHDGTRLQEMLDGFIKKFVLCPNCNNPETTLVSSYYNGFS
jgi:translation initiation factor 5